ncbi:MAG: PilZ domain-containing protein [candidate division Zixibacteria bacterium]|nr:PilZ domain-containing protein [candidate division Zixibacteria bacterium]
MNDDRKETRTEIASFLEIREGGSDREIGRVTEITTEGMKLQSPEPMEPDATFELEMSMPPAKRTRGAIRFNAQVIWCNKSEETGLYESGIQMKDISNEDLAEIKQIMDEAPFEQRRLNLHRPRPMEH